MKYTKPTLRSIDSESELYCGTGSGAAGFYGCTEGGIVDYICSFGLEDAGYCADGGTAYGVCFFGYEAFETRTRCYDGTGPS